MMRRPVFSLAVLSISCLAQLGGSCATDTDVHYSEGRRYREPAPVVVHEERVYREPDRVYVEPPPRERVYIEPDRGPRGDARVYEDAPRIRQDVRVYEEDRGTPRDRSHLPGGIPRGSDLVKDEKGKIRWTADDSGTFYLYDVNKDFIRYSGPVRRGQEVIIMPGDDIIYVEQRAVSHENLQHDNRHRIYFARGIRDNVTEADRGEGRRTGGAGDPGQTMPKGVARISSGKGDLAINAARRGGKVFIYDEDNRNVIYAADIDRGNSFKLQLNNGTVYVNSKKIANVNTPRGHTLSLYIDEH